MKNLTILLTFLAILNCNQGIQAQLPKNPTTKAIKVPITSPYHTLFQRIFNFRLASQPLIIPNLKRRPVHIDNILDLKANLIVITSTMTALIRIIILPPEQLSK